MIKIKIICLTPKGKAGQAMHHFTNWLSVNNKPIESTLVTEEKFYLIYNCKDNNEFYLFINHRIPKTIQRIRQTYRLIIHAVKRANKVGNKFNWAIDRSLRFAQNLYKNKTGAEAKDALEIIKDIKLDDLEQMEKFLLSEIITWELIQ